MVNATLMLPIAALGGAVVQAIAWIFHRGATARSRKAWLTLLVLTAIGSMPAYLATIIVFYALSWTL